MLQTSFSAKKSSPVNCKLFSAPIVSKKKGIAAPAGKEAVVPGLRHLCLPPRRDRCSFEDRSARRRLSRRPLAFNTAQCRSLRPALSDEKRTRYAISATKSPSVSILSS